MFCQSNKILFGSSPSIEIGITLIVEPVLIQQLSVRIYKENVAWWYSQTILLLQLCQSWLKIAIIFNNFSNFREIGFVIAWSQKDDLIYLCFILKVFNIGLWQIWRSNNFDYFMLIDEAHLLLQSFNLWKMIDLEERPQALQKIFYFWITLWVDDVIRDCLSVCEAHLWKVLQEKKVLLLRLWVLASHRCLSKYY